MAARGLIGLQAPGGLRLGGCTRISVALPNDPHRPVVLARHVVDVVLREMSPLAAEVLPDLRPLLGNRLGGHVPALPVRGISLRHPRAS